MKHYYFTLFFSLFLFSAFAQDIELKSINKKEKEAAEKVAAEKEAEEIAEENEAAAVKAAANKVAADKAAVIKAEADRKAAADKVLADKKAEADKAVADKKAADDKAVAVRLAREKAKLIGFPRYAFLSVLMPGMGDRIVNKQTKVWPLVTGLYLSAIGTAVYFKIKSNSNFELYHNVKYSTDGNFVKNLDSYYKIANDNNKNFNMMLGIAGSILLADVVYVAVKGTKNKKNLNTKQTFIFPTINFNANGTKAIQFSLIQKF